MTSAKKRVAVIGGGLSGLGSIGALKEEGIEPICFEKTDKFGGTWCYREESIDGVASIMPTTIINHSKEMGAISRYPPKKEYNNYMRHNELYEYVTEMVKHFDIERHIQYNTEVIEVKRAADYDETGRWIVTVKNNITGKISTDIYDNVMVCVGHINRPKMAIYPGQEKFSGTIMHTHSLKGVEKFKGKNVVIVGIGCSALDAAVEISSVAKQVYLSTRGGAYIINRVGPNGYPIDYILMRRYITWFLDILPANLCSWYIETFYLDPKFNHRLFTVQPKYHVFSKDPVLNDQIGSKLLSGSVVMKDDIDHFTENGVVFQGDKDVTEVDTIIMATGYTWKFPFLEEGVLVKEDGRFNLYKLVFPTQLKHPTLAIIGFLLPFGPGFPAGELQCRWVTQVFVGKAQLPSEEVMLKDAIDRHNRNKKRYAPNDKMTLRVDCVQYMDEIATELGVKPNLLKLLVTDFPLFLRLVFGPCVSYQYRLDGPHKWEGAREAVMTSRDRMLWPLRKDKEIKKGFLQSIVEFIGNLIPSNIFV